MPAPETIARPWPPLVRDVLGHDLVTALGYRTPAGGVVVLPVAPMGMYDESAGTLSFTTPFAGHRKLTRLQRDDRVALAFHTRAHSPLADPSRSGDAPDAFVLVQGHAQFAHRPDPDFLAWFYDEQWPRFTGPRRHGPIWDRIAAPYYDARVCVTVRIHRITLWTPGEPVGHPEVVSGAECAARAPDPQPAPRGGTEPRVRHRRYRRRLERSTDTLAGWADSDGYPTIRPVAVERDGDHLRLRAVEELPGERRAGLLAHWFGPQLHPQGSAVLTGWLDGDGRYAPHTLAGYAGPRSARMAAFGTAVFTGIETRRAVRRGLVVDGCWVGLEPGDAAGQRG